MKNVGLVVMIEDIVDDAFLIERRLRKNQISGDLKVFSSCVAALGFMEQLPEGGLPRLMLVSLTLLKEDAFQFISDLRRDPRWHNLLIVGIGNSDRPQDHQRAYDVGANAYFTRKIGFDQLAETIRNLEFVGDIR